MLDIDGLGFLGQGELDQEHRSEGRENAVFGLVGGATGGFIGWKLDGAPGMAMGAVVGLVGGVIASQFLRAVVHRNLFEGGQE